MDAINEVMDCLLKAGLSEEAAIALIARLLHEEAAGFLYCRDELMKQWDSEEEAFS